jgi:hypothetical protein
MGPAGSGLEAAVAKSTASARSSSARCPEKVEAERARTGWRSREKAEKAETKPAGRKGSSSSSSPGEGDGAGSMAVARSGGVTRGSGWSEGRRGKKGCVWRWRSRTIRAQAEHSETARESGTAPAPTRGSRGTATTWWASRMGDWGRRGLGFGFGGLSRLEMGRDPARYDPSQNHMTSVL